MPDKNIDTSDAPALDWKHPLHGRFYKPVKQSVSLRIDADVIDWFKTHHEKYQTALNAALREYVDQHR